MRGPRTWVCLFLGCKLQYDLGLTKVGVLHIKRSSKLRWFSLLSEDDPHNHLLFIPVEDPPPHALNNSNKSSVSDLTFWWLCFSNSCQEVSTGIRKKKLNPRTVVYLSNPKVNEIKPLGTLNPKLFIRS